MLKCSLGLNISRPRWKGLCPTSGAACWLTRWRWWWCWPPSQKEAGSRVHRDTHQYPDNLSRQFQIIFKLSTSLLWWFKWPALFHTHTEMVSRSTGLMRTPRYSENTRLRYEVRNQTTISIGFQWINFLLFEFEYENTSNRCKSLERRTRLTSCCGGWGCGRRAGRSARYRISRWNLYTCTVYITTTLHTPAGEGLGRLLSTRHHRHALADDPERQTNREETSQVSWKKSKIWFYFSKSHITVWISFYIHWFIKNVRKML